MAEHLDIEKLHRLLLESEEQFLKHIEKEKIGVGVYDAGAVPVLCNRAAYELLGLSKDQYIGKSAMDPYWKVIHEDESKFETCDFPIIEVITSYEPKLGVIMGVSRPLTNDRVWLEVNTHPVLHHDGSIQYVFCTYKNVTSRYD